jgi:UDP-N-acetylglucosamine--N-acetylmuramyl-(pentapeptide) pyrophosphoryl-undecaprenol N-acetylglucosamine transferase
MRLLICAGGTGGGVYPALAVLKALQANEDRRSESGADSPDSETPDSGSKVLWVGGEGGIEVDILSRENIPFTAIPAAGVHGVGIKALPGNLWKIVRGFFAARRIIKEFRPQVMLFTGGYLAVPVAAAGRLMWPRKVRPEIVVYVPDIEPGLALQVTARFSDQIMLTVEDSMEHFGERSNLIVTGYPTRLSLGLAHRDEALQQFNLSPQWPTLLVFGGSKGARSINQALSSILIDLLAEMQVIHITGKLDWSQVETVSNDLPDYLRDRYHAYPYLHKEMGAAICAADLVVSRAGASVLGEFPLYGLPAILVPYPHAWRYQEVNANYLENRGAALVLQDHELSLHLFSTIQKLMRDFQMRNEMSQAMSSLASPQAAESIADILQDLVSVPSPGRI